jgi:hypothetical protein
MSSIDERDVGAVRRESACPQIVGTRPVSVIIQRYALAGKSEELIERSIRISRALGYSGCS